MARMVNMFIMSPDNGAHPATVNGGVDDTIHDQLFMPRNLSPSDEIQRLLTTYDFWVKGRESRDALDVLKILTARVIRQRAPTLYAWMNLRPLIQENIKLWIMGCISGFAAIDSEMTALATVVLTDFTEESTESHFDDMKFMQILNKFMNENPRRQLQAIRMYSIYVGTCGQQGPGDLEFVVHWLHDVLADNLIRANTQMEVQSQCEAIALIVLVISKFDPAEKVKDCGILEMISKLLDSVDRRLHEDLIIEICNFTQFAIVKFDDSFDTRCCPIFHKLAGFILSKSVSQKLAINCANAVAEGFTSPSRSQDMMGNIGQRIIKAVLALLMKGLQITREKGDSQIYDEICNGRNPYLDAGLRLILKIVCQLDTHYDLLNGLDLLYKIKLDRDKAGHIIVGPSKLEQTDPLSYKNALLMFTAQCIKPALVHIRENPFVFSLIMSKIFEDIVKCDELSKSCSRYALFEILYEAQNEDFMKTYIKDILNELNTAFLDLLNEAQLCRPYSLFTFDRMLTVLRVISKTPEFKKQFTDFLFMFGDRFIRRSPPPTAAVSVISLRVFTNLVYAKTDGDQSVDYIPVTRFLDRFKIDSMLDHGVQVAIYTFELLEALTRTMAELCVSRITLYYSWASEALNFGYPELRKAVYSWFGRLNDELIGLIEESPYCMIVVKMTDTLQDEAETILPDSGIFGTPPPRDTRASSTSSDGDLIRRVDGMEIDSDGLEFHNLEAIVLDSLDEVMPFEGQSNWNRNSKNSALKHAEIIEKTQIVETLLECANNIGQGRDWVDRYAFAIMTGLSATTTSESKDLQVAAIEAIKEWAIYIDSICEPSTPTSDFTNIFNLLFATVARIIHTTCDLPNQPFRLVEAIFECTASVLLVYRAKFLDFDPDIKENLRRLLRSTFEELDRSLGVHDVPAYRTIDSFASIDNCVDSAISCFEALGYCIPNTEFEILFGDIIEIFIVGIQGYGEFVYLLTLLGKKTMTAFIGASMKHLKNNLATGHVGIFQMFLHRCVSDEEPCVRSNAVYALGEMLQHCQERAADHFDAILCGLLSRVGNENHPHTKDNLVAALSKILPAYFWFMTPADVLPVIFDNLPLRVDMMEHDSVFHCLLFLIENNFDLLHGYMKQIRTAAHFVLENAHSLDNGGKCLKSENILQQAKTILEKIGHEFITQEELAALEEQVNLNQGY